MSGSTLPLAQSETTAASNAYWDEVCQWLAPEPMLGRSTLGGRSGRTVDPDGAPVHEQPWFKAVESRHGCVARWSWTVSDPATVDFVAEHCGPKVIDPLAGTGWWAHLLSGRGVDVVAYDLHPAGSDENRWHAGAEPHHPIGQMDGVEAVREHGAGRTLLLSWPPYDQPLGADVLRAYTGDLVVYMGEWGDACGDEDMVRILDEEWEEVVWHRPVVWMGLHDIVAVLHRRTSPPVVAS